MKLEQGPKNRLAKEVEMQNCHTRGCGLQGAGLAQGGELPDTNG